MSEKKHIAIVGGPDVDARIPLICRLQDEFRFSVLGASQELREKFAAYNVPFYFYPLASGANPAGELKSIQKLKAIFHDLKPDLVHTFDTKPGVVGRIAAHRAGVKNIIGTLPGLGSLYSENSLKTRVIRAMYQPLQKYACSVSQNTIFQNHDDRDQFVNAGVLPHQKAEIILGSGIDTEKFSIENVKKDDIESVQNTIDFKPGEVIITMISRVIRTKGVLAFKNAAHKVQQKFPKARFILVGPDDKNSIDRLTEKELNGLRKTVTWIGPYDNIPAVLAVSDVFVLPSAYREGIPRVLMEAASMGLPLITTNTPGCNEVVRDGENGILVPPKDENALVEAIFRMIKSDHLRIQFGNISKSRARKDFDISVIVEAYRKLYNIGSWSDGL